MRISKLERINNEVEKTKSKISELQTKLRALERQKTDLEDAEIVSIVRSEKISDAELTLLMQSLRLNKKSSVSAGTGVSESKQKKEESHNAN